MIDSVVGWAFDIGLGTAHISGALALGNRVVDAENVGSMIVFEAVNEISLSYVVGSLELEIVNVFLLEAVRMALLSDPPLVRSAPHSHDICICH